MIGNLLTLITAAGVCALGAVAVRIVLENRVRALARVARPTPQANDEPVA